MSRGGKIIVSALFVTSALFALTPAVAMAEFKATDPLVPCGSLDKNKDGMIKDLLGQEKEECGFNDFIVGIANVTTYFIILGAALSALAFAYAGFLMVTAAGEMVKIEEAKAIFTKVLIGFLIMLSAWLIVHAINAAFVSPSFVSPGGGGVQVL